MQSFAARNARERVLPDTQKLAHAHSRDGKKLGSYLHCNFLQPT